MWEHWSDDIWKKGKKTFEGGKIEVAMMTCYLLVSGFAGVIIAPATKVENPWNKNCSMLVFLLQELSDVDLRDEQELCDSLVEDLQVSFLWTVTEPPLACISGGWHSRSTLLRNDRPFLWTTRSVWLFSFLARLHIGVISFWMYVAWPSL